MDKLVHFGLITSEQLSQAKFLQRVEGGLIGEKLIDLGFVNGDKMQRFASRVLDEI